MQRTLEETLQWLSGFAKEVAVASTFHEPDHSLLEGLQRLTQPLRELGLDWYLSGTAVSRNDKPNSGHFWNLLNNFHATTDTDLPELFSQYNPKADFIEANHYKVLLQAARSGKPLVLYMDLDRITVGANYYPQEFVDNLRAGLEQAKQGNVVSFTRSPSANNTHLASLVLTEGIIHPPYNRALSIRNSFVDLLSTGYMAPAGKLAKLLETYQGGEFLGVRSHYPHSKVMLQMMQENGMGLNAIQTDQMLRYEWPEQARGMGKFKLGKHEWTPEQYEKVTLASRPFQEETMQNPREWIGRFTTVHQYLNVLQKLWMEPRGKIDGELLVARAQVEELLAKGDIPADVYRARAIELSKRFQHY
ncbi:MAG: hypothetical protein AABY00_04315 [Nanoarchaeota archaeon]